MPDESQKSTANSNLVYTLAVSDEAAITTAARSGPLSFPTRISS